MPRVKHVPETLDIEQLAQAGARVRMVALLEMVQALMRRFPLLRREVSITVNMDPTEAAPTHRASKRRGPYKKRRAKRKTAPVENDKNGKNGRNGGTAHAPKRGEVKALIASDLKKVLSENPGFNTADAGRALFAIAKQRGIKTTLGSVTQAVSKYAPGATVRAQKKKTANGPSDEESFRASRS